MANYAVLTGDIVKSSQLPEGGLDRIFANLERASDLIAGWQDAPTYLTRNRGDGWQMAVAPQFALRAVFAARAAVRMTDKRFDTRVALALGDGVIPGDTLADAHGPVFTASGQALEAMPRRRDMIVVDNESTLAVALRLAEEIIKRWTEAQAEVALLALDPENPSQAALAASLDVTKQTIQQHAEASGIDALIEACEVLDA
ncbi:hypothetical protein MWU60_04365 [Yoonia sp. F2084L]|uniref:hypothetical protein n=1 Tax=Yoonia sp. F2084L TaxID=2926419 RepID=UPI001FF4E689|nr:hypothetical protein [Yoonia sp. F2084L]MCK0094790.1 hypothetical protein [Yoonia sp. F2084L]